jgi:hypothetical protein
MFLAHKLQHSLKRTMDKTNVWGSNNYVFKLSGAGKEGHTSKDLKDNLAKQLQNQAHTARLTK